MYNRISDFTLTKKWASKIRGLAYQKDMPYEEALQEAYILEWKLQQNIQDLKHRENYFLKCLKHKIYAYGTSWWDTKRVQGKTPGLDIIDTLIEISGFNEVFYENLITHITFLLGEIDQVAAELFVIRVNTQKRWNAIQKDFPHIKHSRFYNYVSEIKRIVEQEVCRT